MVRSAGGLYRGLEGPIRRSTGAGGHHHLPGAVLRAGQPGGTPATGHLPGRHQPRRHPPAHDARLSGRLRQVLSFEDEL